VRCSWCQRKATARSLGANTSPDCGRERCDLATHVVWLAVQALRVRLARGRAVSVVALDAATRDARAAELRTGPVDWTRPVEGWTLWGEPGLPDAVSPTKR